jgi:hypothetical protein
MQVISYNYNCKKFMIFNLKAHKMIIVAVGQCM